MFGGKIALIMGTVILMMGGAFYAYFSYAQAEMKVLQENAAKLETAFQTQKATTLALEARMVQFQEENQKLTKDLRKAEEYKDELIGKLQRHDLTRLSEQKPKLIEKRINNATKKLFDDIEQLTAETIIKGLEVMNQELDKQIEKQDPKQ